MVFQWKYTKFLHLQKMLWGTELTATPVNILHLSSDLDDELNVIVKSPVGYFMHTNMHNNFQLCLLEFPNALIYFAFLNASATLDMKSTNILATDDSNNQ